MTWWHGVAPQEDEEQLEKELRFHVDQHEAELIARGYAPDEACGRARLALAVRNK